MNEGKGKTGIEQRISRQYIKIHTQYREIENE